MLNKLSAQRQNNNYTLNEASNLMFNLIKIITINFAVLLFLLGSVTYIPPVLFEVVNAFRTRVPATWGDTISPQVKKTVYAGYDWSDKHFDEEAQLTTQYYDYIGWRRNDFSGETINITDGIRLTSTKNSVVDDKTVYWFFGGSTTWGSGVNDEFTYPSIFSTQNGVEVKNYGEGAYIARQSLAYLTNLILGGQYPKNQQLKVIFYDGVNDVVQRCRSEISGLGTGREAQIRSFILEHQQAEKDRYRLIRTLQQPLDFISRITRDFTTRSNVDGVYDCQSNPERAFEVAESLVSTWEVAQKLASSVNADFEAILQPVAFIGAPNITELNLTSESDLILKRQYEAVYPLIKTIAEERGIALLDLTGVYDECGNCYVDFCHVGPGAHAKLVEALTKAIVD